MVDCLRTLSGLPTNVAFGPPGKKETDMGFRPGRPTYYRRSEGAREGLLQPMGEYKGVALRMVMGILSSMLSGSSNGTELGTMESGPAPG